MKFLTSSSWRFVFGTTLMLACSPDSSVGPGELPPGSTIQAASPTVQVDTVGQPVHPPLVQVRSGRGDPVEGIVVTFQITAGDGTLAAQSAATDRQGRASAAGWTLGKKTGTQTVTATIPGAPPLAFTATALPGRVTSIVRGGEGQSALPLSAVREPLTVKLSDSFGNPVPGVRVTATPPSGSGSLAIATATTDSSGVAALGPWTLGAEPGLHQALLSFLPDPPGFQKLFFTAFACDRIEGGQCQIVAPDCSSREACGEIVFTSKRSGNAEIYSINRDGTRLTRLTQHPAGDFSPAWSPDARRIAFISDRDGKNRLYIMDANGSNVVRHPYDGDWIDTPAWSPDASEIAVSVISAGERKTAIVKAAPSPENAAHTVIIPGGFSMGTQPSWFPDGKRIAMNVAPNDDTIFVATVNSDGTNFMRIPTTAAVILNAAWSPDGRQMAVNFYSAGAVHVALHGDNDTITSLATTQLFGKISWSPDGKLLAFSHGPNGARGLSVISSDGGSVPTVITADGYDPDWRR